MLEAVPGLTLILGRDGSRELFCLLAETGTEASEGAVAAESGEEEQDDNDNGKKRLVTGGINTDGDGDSCENGRREHLKPT